MKNVNVIKEKIIWSQSFFENLLSSGIIGIIFSILIPIVLIFVNNKFENRDLINEINKLSIGTTKEFLDKKFDYPKFSNYDADNNILECVYDTKYAIIRAYYINNGLQAFFVTQKENTNSGILLLPYYNEIVNYKGLEEFNYYEIKTGPIGIYAFDSSKYSFYFEVYAPTKDSRYRIPFFGSLDYGKYLSYEELDYEDNEMKVIEEKINNIKPDGFFLNRKKSYPNTYGMCNIDYQDEIFDLLMNYYIFDWDI